MDISKILFRRQFVLSPKKLNEFENWQKMKINDEYYLTVHPDLEINKIKNGQAVLILLGYILDPKAKYKNNNEILSELMEKLIKNNEFYDELNEYGGRFVLIIMLDKKMIILNDATSFREVFYCQDKNNKTWCASQSSILSLLLGFSIDQEIDKDIRKTYIFTKGKEYWYPGNITPYKEINHLSPNHYYDLGGKKEIRYWPKRKIPIINVEQCIEDVSKLFIGLFESAEKRFKLAQTITSGLDSRIILAASKNVSNKIYYFTHTHDNLTIKGNDILIPSKLLKILGIDHHIVQHSKYIDEEFDKAYSINIINGRRNKEINAYTIKKHFETIGQEYVVVNGYCGEITRNFFYLPSIIKINGKILAAMTGMRGSKIAENQFEKWIIENNQINEFGINILDLFYWEQRLGNWASMSCSENDIGFDSFSPFDCRKILELMLGVRKKMRIPPNYKLHKKLIKKLWPEVMNAPINPSTNIYDKLLKRLKRTYLHKIYKIIKFITIK